MSSERPTDLVSVAAAASEVGRSARTLRRWIREHKLVSYPKAPAQPDKPPQLVSLAEVQSIIEEKESARRFAPPQPLSDEDSPEQHVEDPHDRFVRYLLGEPERAAMFLKQVLPTTLTAAISWESLARCPESFVDETLDHRNSDVLFEMSVSGQETLLYVLFEHQSTPEPRMALRLLRYMVRIWDWWLSKQPEANRTGLKLPPIFPMVLAQGEHPWGQPVDLASLVDIPESLEALFAEYFPRISYWVYDVTEQDDVLLREQAMFGLAVLLMKYARQPALCLRLDGVITRVKAVQQTKDRLAAPKEMLRYK